MATQTTKRGSTVGYVGAAAPAGGGGLTDAELRATPVPVSGTVSIGNSPAVTVTSGAITETNSGAIKTAVEKIPSQGQALAAASLPVVLTAAQESALTPPAAITGFATETTLGLIKTTDGIKKIVDALPAGTNLLGKVGIDQTTPGTTNKVSLGTDTVAVKETRSSTGASTTASVGATTTVILASNANRLGATIYNESGAAAYVKLGATASLTTYTLKVAIDGYYEVPSGYTGAINGITASGTAVLRVTELT